MPDPSASARESFTPRYENADAVRERQQGRAVAAREEMARSRASEQSYAGAAANLTGAFRGLFAPGEEELMLAVANLLKANFDAPIVLAAISLAVGTSSEVRVVQAGTNPADVLAGWATRLRDAASAEDLARIHAPETGETFVREVSVIIRTFLTKAGIPSLPGVSGAAAMTVARRILGAPTPFPAIDGGDVPSS